MQQQVNLIRRFFSNAQTPDPAITQNGILHRRSRAGPGDNLSVSDLRSTSYAHKRIRNFRVPFRYRPRDTCVHGSSSPRRDRSIRHAVIQYPHRRRYAESEAILRILPNRPHRQQRPATGLRAKGSINRGDVDGRSFESGLIGGVCVPRGKTPGFDQTTGSGTTKLEVSFKFKVQFQRLIWGKNRNDRIRQSPHLFPLHT